MKKFIIAAGLAAAVAAPAAFAQAKNFEGWSIGANLNSIKTTTDFSTGVSYDGTKATLDLNAQYDWAINNQFVLGLGITLGTEAAPSGSVSGVDLSNKDRIAFNLTPGFAVSNDALLFGKVSYNTSTGAISAGSASVTKSLSGLGYGFGARYALNKSAYLQGGYDWVNYDSVDVTTTASAKVKSTSLYFGVGYKF